MKKIVESSFVIILLLPLLFTNIKSSHDWGDDFAQYIHQAKNLISGVSQNETGYIFNDQLSIIGPKAYPVGFPILIAPVIYKFAINYTALNIYLSCYLLLSCFVGFLFLKKYFSIPTAIITTLIIAYNPTTLIFKTEILSDIPFWFFSTLILFLALQKPTATFAIFIGLLLGFSMHIRSVTFILLVSIVVNLVFYLIRNKPERNVILKHIFLLVSCYLLMYFSIKFLVPANSNYPKLFIDKDYFSTAINHFSYQLEEIHRFFRNYEIKDYYFILCLTASALITFAGIGFLYNLKKGINKLLTIYISLYIITLSVYAHGDNGVRMLFPLFFVIFYYAIVGLKKSFHAIELHVFFMPYIIGFFVLFSYTETWQRISEHEKDVYNGPETEFVKKMFSYIKNNIPVKAVVAFEKPRAFSLCTNRSSICLANEINESELLNQVNRYMVSYIATCESITSAGRIKLLEENKLLFRKIYDNGQCKIYQCL